MPAAASARSAALAALSPERRPEVRHQAGKERDIATADAYAQQAVVADDGTAFVLENDMVIGRDPAAFVAQRAGRSLDGAGRLAPVVLPDRTGALSRAHLEIRIDGWQVLAVDVGSANGTWVRPPGAAQPLRLPPGQPVPLGVGSDIHLGGRILQLQDGVGG